MASSENPVLAHGRSKYEQPDCATEPGIPWNRSIFGYRCEFEHSSPAHQGYNPGN
jgi:hypothetical protein